VYMEHIKIGVKIARDERDALLMFSGGQTRPAAGPMSEATSYWKVADANGWLHDGGYVWTVTEEFSTDSFDNVVYGVCRFEQVVGIVPKRIVVVGFEYKRMRFVEYGKHLNGIAMEYVGFDGPLQLNDSSHHREYEASLVKQFHECSHSLSKKKNVDRNPFRNVNSYGSCPNRYARCL
jgi:hypothetical protein